MKITVAATPLNAHYVMQQPLKWLKVKRHTKYFKEYLYQKKYRDSKTSPDRSYNEKAYSKNITFQCTTLQGKRLRIQMEDTPIVITSFNKGIRNLFYSDFFIYMDKWMLFNEYSLKKEYQIREIVLSFMGKYTLDETHVKLHTLLRNYRRYRENPENSMDEALELISEDEISV